MDSDVRAGLSGLRVIELAQGVPGSYCGKLFADLGADVIKVEPPEGDPSRVGASGEADPAFLHYNTNKRSVVVDLRRQADREMLERLVETADLVIEARGSGSMAELGIDWDTLHERAPSLVVAALSGFGGDGPYRDYKSSDLVAQAFSGALLLQDTDQQPLRFPLHLGSCLVGNLAAVGALGALTSVAAGAPGRVVDCSAVEALATIPPRLSSALAHQYRDGQARPPALQGDTLIPIGVFPCADGNVGLMSTPQQLAEMLTVLDSAELTEAFARPDAFMRPETKELIDLALYPWLMSHTRAEATTAAQAAGWPLTGVNAPSEVLEAGHLHQRGFWVRAEDPRVGPVDLPGAPYRFTEGGWRVQRLAPELGEHTDEVAADGGASAVRERAVTDAPLRSEPRLPLEGIRVVDMTTVWSGPYATMLLADLGAEVIRVENPFVLPPTTKGYTARPENIENLGYLGSMYGPHHPVEPDRPDRPWNRHALNNGLSRNKLSVTIDTRRPEGLELLMQLCDTADIFIENLKSYSMGRMGIDISRMQTRNPRLIVLRTPPTGLSGDWGQYTGFGMQFDSLSGMLWVCGHRNTHLTASPATTYMDAATGPSAAFAALAALRYRSLTGRGQLIELAQMENTLNHLGEMFMEVQAGGEPARMGNRATDRAPQGLYPGRGENRWLAISIGTTAELAALASAIGHPELGTDPRLATLAGRIEHHDELDDAISSWTIEHDVLDAFELLQARGVPAAPLMDEAMFVADPQIVSRAWMQPLTSSDVGTHLHPGQAFRGVEQAWRRGSPCLGEDNAYVYKEILGVSDAEYERYAESRILAEDYLALDGTAL